MKSKRKIYLMAIVGMLALSGTSALAQEKDKKESEKKEYKKDKDYEKGNRDKNKDDRYENGERRNEKAGESGRQTGGILGRVILPRAGSASPRQLAGVPKGHYPPPGSCRVWYPNRPAGHQPPPTSCDNLRNIRLEQGAFILHGDRAYDADYDWNEEERRRPGSVSRDILDILFPGRRN